MARSEFSGIILSLTLSGGDGKEFGFYDHAEGGTGHFKKNNG